MSAADQLRLLWLKGVQEVSGRRFITAENFFTSKNITPDHIYDPQYFKLYVGNARKSVEYFAHEADRFSSAAFETLSSEAPRQEYPQAIAWTLIRGYYAAFFAFHALIRLHGWSCTTFSVCDPLTTFLFKQSLGVKLVFSA